MRPIPTHKLLTKFANLDRNICVVGDKRLVLAFCNHEAMTFTAAYESRVFKWPELLSFLEQFLKRYGSIGARIKVYHHTGNYFYTVRKVGQRLFTLPDVTQSRADIINPVSFVVNPSVRELNTVTLEGWDELRDEIIEFMENESDSSSESSSSSNSQIISSKKQKDDEK